MSVNAHLKMANVTIYHVYNCSHFEVDKGFMEGFNGPQFVFVEGPCSHVECANTDAAWFAEQCFAPGRAALNALATLTNELQNIRIVVKANLDRFDAMDLMPTDQIAVLAHPDVVDLLLDDDGDREELLEGLFHFSLTSEMLGNMRTFAKRSTARPFFDFCRREAQSYIDNAKANVEKLHNTVTILQQYDIPVMRIPTYQWPSSQANYEPDFGVEELELLRAAGERGQDILAQPFNLSALHNAEIMVACMKQKLAATSARCRPTCAAPSDGLDAWLQQEEKAFQAETAMRTQQSQIHACVPQRKPLPKVDTLTASMRGRSALPQLV